MPRSRYDSTASCPGRNGRSPYPIHREGKSHDTTSQQDKDSLHYRAGLRVTGGHGTDDPGGHGRSASQLFARRFRESQEGDREYPRGLTRNRPACRNHGRPARPQDACRPTGTRAGRAEARRLLHSYYGRYYRQQRACINELLPLAAGREARQYFVS